MFIEWKTMFCLITSINFFFFFFFLRPLFQVNKSCRTSLTISKMAKKRTCLKIEFLWSKKKHILMVWVIICSHKRLNLYHKIIFGKDYFIFFKPHSRKCLRWRKLIIPVYNWIPRNIYDATRNPAQRVWQKKKWKLFLWFWIWMKRKLA